MVVSNHGWVHEFGHQASKDDRIYFNVVEKSNEVDWGKDVISFPSSK